MYLWCLQFGVEWNNNCYNLGPLVLYCTTGPLFMCKCQCHWWVICVCLRQNMLPAMVTGKCLCMCGKIWDEQVGQ